MKDHPGSRMCGRLADPLSALGHQRGVATRVTDNHAAEGLALRLFRALPRSKRFVTEDPKQLAVYMIEPVAIALVDYASGFGTTYVAEL